jgi:RNA polymerase sigma factor (sigma-70 family)
MADRQASDADLVARARTGDRVALAVLVERHRSVAEALCVRLLGRPDLAEDAVQEAVVVAIVGLDRLRRPDRFGPWLCGIALNVVRRWLRAAAERPASTAHPLDGIDHGPDPEQAALAKDEATRVRRAVADLPPGQRDAVALYYLGERTGAEVADLLAISTHATKTRLHKARRTLRASLAHVREDMTVTDTIDMHVADVRREPTDTATGPARHAIVLEDEAGDRRLPIFVGQPEAVAIALRLHDTELPRPLTHMLLANVIDALGARVTEVRVTRLADQTFFGEIELTGPNGTVAVDARPSDAINVALLAEAPIRVGADVLRAADTGPSRYTDLTELTDGSNVIAVEFEDSFAELMRGLGREP